MRKNTLFAMRCTAVLLTLGFVTGAQGASLEVAGSPTGIRGGTIPYAPGSCVNDSGIAVGFGYKNDGGTDVRAVRWDASGAATELGNLGTDSGGTLNYAFAVNSTGIAVGSGYKYVGGTSMGYRAIRWDASDTATELGNLGTDSSGGTSAEAYAVNSAGTAVGYAAKFVGDAWIGYRAVRWNASGTATELGNLGTESSGGYTDACAHAINNAGTAVGYAMKWVGGADAGYRAVRWNASGGATELGNLGTDSNGYTEARAYAVNGTGIAVGYAFKYVGGYYKGDRAVRWNASGTAAAELGNLGTDSSGYTSTYAYSVNSAGTAVGYAPKFVGTTCVGDRAVRWNGTGTAATELGNLGTNSSGVTNTYACALNSAGTAVGYAEKYVDGVNNGSHATIWLPDASVIDLNDLGVAPVPAGGTWTLTAAKAMSEDGFVAGEGPFDPDGSGPLAAYTRLWVAQIGLGGNWTKPAGGVWGRGPNWSTGTPAMQVGNARFNLPVSYSVALDRDELTKSIAVQAGNVTFDLAGHSLSTETRLDVAPGATLQTAGAIHGDLCNSGVLALSSTTSTLTLDGNLTNSGTLALDIASLSSCDKLSIRGTLTAGGTIAVALRGGYQPAPGDSFDLLDCGTFADLGYTFDFSAASLAAGYAWDTTSFAANGTIAVVPEPGTVLLLAFASLALIRWAYEG